MSTETDLCALQGFIFAACSTLPLWQIGVCVGRNLKPASLNQFTRWVADLVTQTGESTISQRAASTSTLRSRDKNKYLNKLLVLI